MISRNLGSTTTRFSIKKSSNVPKRNIKTQEIIDKTQDKMLVKTQELMDQNAETLNSKRRTNSQNAEKFSKRRKKLSKCRI